MTVKKLYSCLTAFVFAWVSLVSPYLQAESGQCNAIHVQEPLDVLDQVQAFKGERSKRSATYNPFNLFGNSIRALELMGQRFYTPTDKGSIVGIAAVEPGTRQDLNQAGIDFLTGRPFANGRTVFHYEADSALVFFSQLQHAYDKSGPIYRLAIYAHGMPGRFWFGKSGISARLLETLKWKTYLAGLPKDLFAPNAQIVLISCSAARGNILSPDNGVNQLKKIFGSFVKQGATIVASRRLIDASTNGFEEAAKMGLKDKEFKDFSTTQKIWLVAFNLLILPLALVKSLIDSAWVDGKTKHDPIELIDLPPSKETL